MMSPGLGMMLGRVVRMPVVAARRYWNMPRRPPLLPVLILLVIATVAIFPNFIAPDDPYKTKLSARMMPPAWLDDGGKRERLELSSTSYLLGTDQLGRDVLSRLLHGARVSLTVGFFAVIVAGGIGLSVGLLSGYKGGWIDAALMRLVDAVIAIPFLLIALLFASALGPSERNVIIVISAFVWTGYARVIRSEVLSLREREYVVAAVAVGASTFRVLVKHVLPNVLPTFLVLITLQIGALILAEAALSFLGAGVPPPTPAWGSMVAEGRNSSLTAWWLTLFPGMGILLVVLAFNLVGDWLRDVLDPRTRPA